MSEKPVILAVDSNRRNLELLTQSLEREGYQTRAATSLAELDQAIEGEERIALALIDVSGFGRGIWERCQRLKDTKTPFLVLAGKRSPVVQQESLHRGASGVLVKPVGTKELVTYMRTLLGE